MNTIKNTLINIRKAEISDAESISIFINKLDNESEYLLYAPNERKINSTIASHFLTSTLKSDKSIVFIAENERKEIIGYICGEVSQLKRLSHIMRINIGVLKSYQIGIGRLLGSELLEYAKNKKIVRLEVTVITENKISLNLIKRFGFEIEGIKKKSIKIEDHFYDEYMLAKLLIN